ncbi:NACHT domain-containing protein [Roseateles cellulosilyticus]|uniref:NACHT domain-containing protein n=1 Tax=Pelomonas cellulosilytica TaxID=2906762 RepID=UPI001F2CDFD9|nr:hypothetical protein [Pelomonas sp. P8]
MSAEGRPETRPLEAWRGIAAYVLLGDPGSGKSASFREEGLGEGCVYISARDFISLGIERSDHGKTLFIDGLDEMRAGAADGRIPLDAIRAKLKELGRPRFRLSCREHDWRSQTDLDALRQVAPNGEVDELHLEPLSQDEQRQILVGRPGEVPDADAFLEQGAALGLAPLFGNPLLLDLTIRAVADNQGWPATRCDIYGLACRTLVTEQSPAHLEVLPLQPGDVDQILDDAGLLCALLLFSGKSSLTKSLEGSVTSIAWHSLPKVFELVAPQRALASKVFTTIDGESFARHRSIAEFLAARSIAERLSKGLPLGRILALMQGTDGGVVEPLRGLLGWLTVHDARDRLALVELDPLSIVLNGDVAAFSVDDKRALLAALRAQAERNPWFRNQHWASHPFAPLASADMADVLEEVLADRSPDRSNQAFMGCVFDALINGEPMQELRSLLEAWVEDDAVWFGNRILALKVWMQGGSLEVNKARSWLEQFRDGSLKDLDARLSSELLDGMYPEQLGPDEVFRFWPKPGDIARNTTMPRFWYSGLVNRSRPHDFPKLVNAWLQLKPQSRTEFEGEWNRLRTGILAGALENAGDQADDATLSAWLDLGMDKHGFAKLDADAGGARISSWLTGRPGRMKAIVALAWDAVRTDPQSGRRYFWEGEQRLLRATLPRDWFYWLLQHAATKTDQQLAEYCFLQAARAVVDTPAGFDIPSIEEIEGWVAANTDRHPSAVEWLEQAFSCALEGNWQGEEHRRLRRHEAETRAKREARRIALAPHVPAILDGSAPSHVMHQFALACGKRFYDIQGETPEELAQDFLVTDVETSRAALAGLNNVFVRADLPSADDILELNAKGRYHLIRPALLLAARRASERDVAVVDGWSDKLLSTLIASWLTDGTETPAWYSRAAEARPSIVAPLLIRHAIRALRRKGPLHVSGLWALTSEPKQAELARMVLPELLLSFPQRSSEESRRELNSHLLSGLHLLDDALAASIVRRRLDNPSIDAAQRLCWLAADLPYRDSALQQLTEFVGKNQKRLAALGNALHQQSSVGRSLRRVSPKTLSRLIEALAPITRPERPTGAHWVSAADERGDTVRALVTMLAADPQRSAAIELQRLAELPQLEPWAIRLNFSALSQQDVAREAYYAHPTPEAAALTIAGGPPANQADLLALTLDHLGDLEKKLRGADTFGLRLYWNSTKETEATPKVENDCRDLLLEQLRERFRPLNVHVVPERRAAAEKRSDLRVEYSGSGRQLAVPIEIKREDNASLWLAWRDQLQKLYSNDPTADGHGIYLVLWFDFKPRSSPEGDRPTSARTMEAMLVERVPVVDRAKVAIRAINLSLPK